MLEKKPPRKQEKSVEPQKIKERMLLKELEIGLMN